MQGLVVALVVAASFGYAAWTLMPARWRQALAQRLLRWPALGRWGVLRQAAAAGGGCGCSGCDAAAPAPGPKTIQVVRRR